MFRLISNLGVHSTHGSEQCAVAVKYKQLYYRAFVVVRVNEDAALIHPCHNCVRVNEDEGERPLQRVDCE